VNTPELGLLDTCAVVHLERLSGYLPQVAHVSEVTMCELEVGIATASTELEKAKRQARLEAILRNAAILPLDRRCSVAFAQVAADFAAQGRKVRSRAYDAMIAATAIAHSLPLFTTNARDFTGISGLDLRPLRVPSIGSEAPHRSD